MEGSDGLVNEFVHAPVPPPLRGRVSSVVGYRSTGGAPGIHRAVPSPDLTLILSLGPPVVDARSEDGTGSTARERLVGGLHRSPIFIHHDGDQVGVQLALTARGARDLLGLTTAALGQEVLDLDAVLGEGALLREQLWEAVGWPARLRVVTDLLTARLSDRPVPRGAEAALEGWRWLQARDGRARPRELADHLGYGERRVRQLFAAELGMSPDEARRLVRFDRARERVQGLALSGTGDLAAVAAAGGYADHPHLVREFHAFLGCSPSRWLDEEFRNIQDGGHRNGAGSQA